MIDKFIEPIKAIVASAKSYSVHKAEDTYTSIITYTIIIIGSNRVHIQVDGLTKQDLHNLGMEVPS